MTTDVHKSFTGPSRFSAMFDHAAKQAAQTSNGFAGQQKTTNGGRWSAVRNHLIDQANADAATPKNIPVYRGGIRLN